MNQKQSIIKIIKQKVNLKRFTLFFIIAFFFLILTKFSETYTQSIVFKVQLSGLKDEITINQDSLTKLNVVLRAKGFNLLPYLLRTSPIIDVNATTYTSTINNAFIFDVKSNRHLVANTVGNAIDVLSVKPDTLYFNFDILSSKTVPVEIDAKVNYSPGFDIVNVLKLSQDSVKLIGSSVLLDKISHVTSEPIIRNDVNNDFTQMVALKAPSPDINIIPNKLRVTASVKRFTEGKISLPISIINVPVDKTLNYFPKFVDLIYYVDLDRFNDVDASNFKIIADYSVVKTSSQKYLDLTTVSTSKIVKNTRLSQNRVEFIVLKK